MKRINTIIPISLILLTLIWLASTDIASVNWAFFPVRKIAMQYTGIIAIVAMSMAMLLALRLPVIERFTQGLDRSYRLHKWLGISSLVLAVIHWLWAAGPKYMVALALLTKPARRSSGAGMQDLTGIEAVFGRARHFAESIGEWGFYLLVLVMIIALTKRVRYNKFLSTHKIMSVLYLIFACHSVILIKFSYWQTPVGWLVAIFIALGCLAAIYSLTGQIGRHNKVSGNIEKLHFYEANQVLAITINSHLTWPGNQPGQFAFVQFNGEEPHPFTITSADHNNGRINFQIKAIGDFTKTIKHKLKLNDEVVVEGPYGYFNFKSDAERQIWVGAGIGIAAFSAQLEKLAQHGKDKEVDLFYCTQSPDRDFIDKIDKLAQQAKINLHLIDSNTQGHLTAPQICAKVSAWRQADVWFCGPSQFANTLKSHFAELGLPASRFHNELFEMR